MVMGFVVLIIVAWAKDDHATWLGHSYQFLTFFFRVVPKNVPAHCYIGKLVGKRHVRNQAIYCENVHYPSASGLCFEIGA